MDVRLDEWEKAELRLTQNAHWQHSVEGVLPLKITIMQTS